MAIDNSKFPERNVVSASNVPEDSRSFQMGHRWNLKLECGHVVATTNTIPQGVVKCMLCDTEANRE